MSKIGNHRLGIQETEDYAFGWASAERGEPEPEWLANGIAAAAKLSAQRLGWSDYHQSEQSRA